MFREFSIVSVHQKQEAISEEDSLRTSFLTFFDKRARWLPDSMKNIPETKARMVRCGRMCPMLLMTKAVKTKSRETIGKGVAVRTISGRKGGTWEKVTQDSCREKTVHEWRPELINSGLFSLSVEIRAVSP